MELLINAAHGLLFWGTCLVCIVLIDTWIVHRKKDDPIFWPLNRRIVILAPLVLFILIVFCILQYGITFDE